MSQLDQLAHHRDAILLAEIGAWLHDDFKHTDQQIHKYVSGAPSPSGRQDTADLVPDAELDFLGKKLKLSLVKNRRKDDFVDGYLNRCHYTAHIEKEDGNSQQTYPAYLSSPFGFEAFQIPTSLTDLLRNNVPWDLIEGPRTNRMAFQRQLRRLFDRVGGDTRRPGNEITLWEWGHTVGALYKAALIGAYFQDQLGLEPTAANDLRWQLLGVRTDALTYLTHVTRLPDLEARKNALQVAIENVKTLLEETYPLATEVYRDENGSLYVVPNLPDLLSLQGSDGDQTLLTRIQQQFATDGEIVPQVTLDPTAWWGQDPDRQGNDEIPPAGAVLALPATLQGDANTIGETWQSKRQEVCPICGLRPCVSKQVDYCQTCGERRKGRVAQWLNDQSKTIWLDEVADGNGRLALITGTFDLTNWLDGSLVETLLVQEPTASNPAVTKNSSFARLRRIWQTTQTFWQKAQANVDETLSDARRRLTITLANQPSLKANQTYELDLQGQTRMSVLWDGTHLISIDNLSYTVVQLGIEKRKQQTPVDAALEIGAWLEERKQQVFQLISDDEKNTQYVVRITNIDYQDTAYATAIPILAQPRTFMALVPADKALDVVQAINTKYKREMGKVRNRLPLHLGVVYFQRRTPLRAALDAGRRMLRYTGMKDDVWTVTGVRGLSRDDLPEALVQDTKQFDSTIAVTLKETGRSLTWHVPKVMGDGTTPDNWYPYVFIRSNKDGNTALADRTRIFAAPNPHTSNLIPQTLVHAAELKEGDQIYFTPATLDFQWLNSTARRFEIAYDANGKRRNYLTRPYLLDQLDEIEAAWGMLQTLSKNQLYALRDTIEQKRTNWFTDPQKSLSDDTFQRFCADVVRNTKWKAHVDTQKLTDWAISGLLADTIQLHVSIMKKDLQSPQEEQPHE